MNFKKCIIFIVLIVFLFSIASVSAADMNETATTSTDENEIELSQNDEKEITGQNENSKLESGNTGTFSELSSEIRSGGNVTLKYEYYSYNNSGDTIEISTPNSVIDGRGAVIDMAGSNFLPFKVTAQGVTFKNLTIINANNKAGSGGAIHFTNTAAQGTVTNCNFTNNSASYGGAVYFEGNGDVINCNFINNKATGTNSWGGAIRMQSGNVTNCNFTGNTANRGGAVYFVDTGDVTNCNFTGNTAHYGSGGAVYFDSNGDVTNCNFTNNTADYGGAVYFNSNGDVTNCNFTNNTAIGGAVCFYRTGTVSNCNFTGNTAYSGGAVYFYRTGTVSNCNFTGNTAYSDGAVYFKGFGDVINCNFTGNTAYRGGAIMMSYGTVSNCNFTNNTASYGGAINIASGTVTNCNFTNNKATGEKNWGGAIMMSYGTVSNCNFTNNNASDDGGAVYFGGTGNVRNCNFTGNTAYRGGAVYFDSNGDVTNCNFVNNTATNGDGGAVYFNNTATQSTLSNCNFTNNNASDDGGAVYFEGNGNVTNCNFADNTATNGDGGAVYIYKQGTVSNCNFADNTANDDGGAVYIRYGGDVTNCNFTGNTADSFGGAIDMGSGSSGTLTNCDFTNNTAECGGAIFFNNRGDVTNCNFVNNTATNYDGGAVYFSSTVSSSTVTNCNFTNNTATNGKGGAIRMYSGSVENCNFTNNNASDDGGAVFFYEDGDITNCNFTNNNASDDGGAVFFYEDGDVTNCNFADNTANGDGGAVYIYKQGTVSNCNFTGNNAAWGSAIYFYQRFSSNTLSISNSSFLDNRASVDYNTALNVTINENNITITFVGQNNLLNAIYSRNDANVTFSNVTYWGEKGKEIANSTRSGSNKEAGQNITIAVVVNDKIVYNNVNVTDDNGTIVLENMKVNGDYYILARHNLDSYYTEAETILTNMPYYVNVMSQTTGNKTVNITAKSNFNEKDGKLRFILPNGTGISANYGAGGIWWAVYEFSNPGVYNVSASYSLGEVNVTEGTITILADVPIIVSDMIITFGDDAVVVVSVPDAINGQNITIAVNSTSKNATVKNGKANATFTNLPAREYVITVDYLGDELNSENSTTAKLTVNKATPKIEVQSYDVIYPDDVVISVKSNMTGLYIVKVGNESKNVTLEAGVEQNVTFTGLPINEEGYVVNVTNADLENCTQSVNDTGIVKVMHAPSYINTDGLITVYNTGGVLFVTLTGIDGEPLAGRGIKVNITGKTYTIITNASGIAGLPINLKPGLHPAYVWFNGDSTYAPSENVSTSVEVYTDSRITGNKDLVKRQGGSQPFKVRALDKYGKPVGAYAKVKMTVAGKTYTVNTDAKGYASLPINLKAGKYKITTSYGGTTVTNTITVKK